MARPRKKGNHDIPINLYRCYGDAWRYRHPVTGKFHGMGTDKSKAVQAARKLNELLIPNEDLVAKVLGDSDNVSFRDFSEEYLKNKRLKDGRPLAKNTLDNYASQLQRIYGKWGDKPIDTITLRMVNEYLDEIPASSANMSRNLLSNIFDVAISKGICVNNPAKITLKRQVLKQRKRHTLEGLTKIRDAAEPWLKNAIDLAMLTTQRRVDICNMKWSDIKDGYLHVIQKKTTKEALDEFEISEGAGYVRIKINAELQAVLDRCKDGIDSPFIVHKANKHKKVAGKEHWTQVLPTHLSESFIETSRRANAYPQLTDKQQPSFHEIRALAIFLHKKIGKSAQTLAGHSTQNMTEHYESGHEIMWNDADIGIRLPFG